MTDRWYDEHLPVLAAAVEGIDTDADFRGVRLRDLADQTGLTGDQVMRAVRALESDGLVEVRWVVPASAVRVVRVSGEARRLVGAWPTVDTVLDRMIQALEAIADNIEADEDTRTRARKILDNLAGAGRQIGIGVATAMATGQLPGAGT